MGELGDLSAKLNRRPDEADSLLDEFIGDSAKEDVLNVLADARCMIGWLRSRRSFCGISAGVLRLEHL